jgi:quinoprotein glucose dehydrogenase
MDNLSDLEVAWVYESPDTGQMQMNPIMVDGVLYGVSAALKAFALDASTGEELWIFGDSDKAWHSTSRGLTYWEDGEDKRILYSVGKDLLALDAKSGQLIETFGEDGRLDLHTGLPNSAKDKTIISNTPGAVFQDLIVMPVRLSEGADAAPGDIRAFNIRDGSLAWTFHVIPYPDEAGYDTWVNKDAYKNENGVGAGNSWAGIAVDEGEGVLYVPTGSLAPDFYGGHRPGQNLYSNCLLALDALTGELIWHQQLTHHDIWDRDLPAPPNLLTIVKDGQPIEVVAQITKQGYVYVFDKKTGEPIYEIEEVPVPASNIEKAWPTQPIPVKPAPFSRRSDEITEEDYSPYAPNKKEIEDILSTVGKDFYSPPDTVPVLLLPGYDGGAEWGGAGVDPNEGIIYINANEMAWLLQVEPTKGRIDKSLSSGQLIYLDNCAVCHKKDLSGDLKSGYPPLINIEDRLSRSEIATIVEKGKGMMTGFGHLASEERNAIVDFVLGQKGDKIEVKESVESKYNIPYKHTGYEKFLDANGLPAISPPWGTLNAIDLNTGDYLWKIPFGEIDSLVELGYPITGTESYGGPIVTENGLLIIAGTKDSKIRIFNRFDGSLLWEDRLPASAFATPTTYMAKGRQFIVIACGGEKLGTPPGNKIVSYALKK